MPGTGSCFKSFSFKTYARRENWGLSIFFSHKICQFFHVFLMSVFGKDPMNVKDSEQKKEYYVLL